MNYMKHVLGAVCVMLAAGAPGAAERAVEPMSALIERDFAVASRQYTHLLDTIRARPGFPRTLEQGQVKLVTARDWTAGFFPGSLWYLSEATGDARWRGDAERYTRATSSARFDNGTHDVGFILGSGYGNGLRPLHGGDASYRDAMLAGATTLVTRFNPKVRAIQSWNLRAERDWKYPVIIDNMMNLELLMWASRASGEPYYREVAIAHADTTLRDHFRPDGSSFHLVDYDPLDGKVRARITVQGNADGSAWARGQAWALYGFTMMYRETNNPAYLAQAQKIAGFIIDHPRLPADKVPYWDFDDAAIVEGAGAAVPRDSVPRDSAAAAIICSALLELRGFVAPALAARYAELAEQQLRSLSSPSYLAAVGENGGFLLKHATGHKPVGSEVDVPLNYADYYFLEALLRYKAMLERG